MSKAAELHRDIARVLLRTFRPRTDIYAVRLDDERVVERINAKAREHGRASTWAVGNYRPVRRWDAERGESVNIPLTLDAVVAHVAGRQTAGFYPLRPDGTCASVSVDFDDHVGAQKVSCDPFADLDALAAVCQRRGARFLANVSRGGRGAWLHLLLPDGTPAAKARAVMGALIRDAGLRHIADGGTFDAIFPKQNDLTRPDRPGNLFCIPVNGRWLRADAPGTHFLHTDPSDLGAQLRALTEY